VSALTRAASSDSDLDLCSYFEQRMKMEKDNSGFAGTWHHSGFKPTNINIAFLPKDSTLGWSFYQKNKV